MNLIRYLDSCIYVSHNTYKKNSQTWNTIYNPILYEESTINEFYNLIKQKNNIHLNIIDIGAQSGCFTLMSKFLPNTTWYSFEASTENYELLKENLIINNITNVNIYNTGIFNKQCIEKLNICKTHFGLNTFGNNLQRFKIEDSFTQECYMNTLDNLFENIKVDFIKIDTEGCECNILEGAINIIKKYKPIILLEYNSENLQQFNKTFDDLNTIISSLNYYIHKKYNDDILIYPNDA